AVIFDGWWHGPSPILDGKSNITITRSPLAIIRRQWVALVTTLVTPFSSRTIAPTGRFIPLPRLQCFRINCWLIFLFLGRALLGIGLLWFIRNHRRSIFHILRSHTLLRDLLRRRLLDFLLRVDLIGQHIISIGIRRCLVYRHVIVAHPHS